MAGNDDRELLEDVLQLPIRAGAALELLGLIDEPECDARDIGRVLQGDPALATRTIYLANSPYYGLAQPVATTSRAATVLGLNTVRALAASAAFGLLDGASVPPGFWDHSLELAHGLTAVDGVPRGLAFCVGLVHDVGAALLYRRDPTAWWNATEGLDGCVAEEQARLGEDHASLGSRALAAARFPPAIVTLVAAHHEADSAVRSFEDGIVAPLRAAAVSTTGT